MGESGWWLVKEEEAAVAAELIKTGWGREWSLIVPAPFLLREMGDCLDLLPKIMRFDSLFGHGLGKVL